MHQRWGASGRAVTGWARSLEAPLWLRQPVLLGTVGLACLGLTLWTNQVFHGGVWGTLHNKSVRPVVELSEATLRDGALNVQLYRVEGADVYGSFAIGLALRDGKGKTVVQWTAEDLAGTAEGDIHNHYVAKVRPGKYSLVLPLGARADVHLRHEALGNLAPGKYQVVLIDISGVSWHTEVTVAAWGIEGVVGW